MEAFKLSCLSAFNESSRSYATSILELEKIPYLQFSVRFHLTKTCNCLNSSGMTLS